MPVSKLTVYSGMSAKIRAMKSNLITLEEFEKIAHFTKVSEVVEYLKTIPAYEEVLQDLDSSMMRRSEVETRLAFSTYYDFAKIYHFAGMEQKKYLKYFFAKYEITVLRNVLRNILDSRSTADPVLTNKHFKFHSSYDVDRVVSSLTIEELIENLKGTLYEKPLRKVYEFSNPTLFDYEMALDLFFFKRSWEMRDQFVPDGEDPLFKRALGSQIDLLNILWIYRCKNYYQVSDASIYSFLIPVNYKLKQSEIKDMMAANNVQDFYELIKDSYYGKKYGFNPEKSIETQFGSYLFDINTYLLHRSPYSIASINSYFYFKNLEVARIITAMEGIRYRYNPETIIQYVDQKRGVI